MNFFRFLDPNLLLFLFTEEFNLQSLIEFFVLCQRARLQNFLSNSIRSSIQSLLPPLNFINYRCINIEIGGAFTAVNRIEGLHQVTKNNVHFLFFFNHEVDRSR